MGTVIRAEVSENNPYHLSKHRTLELRHFCAQYPEWKREYEYISSMNSKSIISAVYKKPRNVKDPTGSIAVKRSFYADRINMLKRVAYGVDPIIGKYILQGVTEELSYEKLNARNQVPCCKDTYYKLYREFFWLLSKERK